jgi:probable rRNA maturation factor
MSGADPASRRRRVARGRQIRKRATKRVVRMRAKRRLVALSVAVVDNLGRPVRVPGLGRWLAAVAPFNVPAAMNVALVGDLRVKALNMAYRGHDRVTDVLSFPALEASSVRKLLTLKTLRVGVAPVELGDVVIASGQAQRQARQVGHSLATELRVLALHGLLHLIGYDHDVDGGAMAALERVLRRKGRLREGLIERAGVRADGKHR